MRKAIEHLKETKYKTGQESELLRGSSDMEESINLLENSAIKSKVDKSLEPTAPNTKHKYIGALLILCGALMYSLQAFLTKILFTDYNMGVIEQFYVKSLTYLVVSMIGLYASGISFYIRSKEEFVFILSRTFFGIGDNLLLSIGIIYLNVSTATALFYIFPIITVVLSWIILKEPIKILEILATIFSFSGVVMNIKPSFLFKGKGNPEIQAANPWYMVVTLGAALSAGCLYVLYKKTSATISYFMMSFYYGAICSIVLPLIYMFAPYKKEPLNFIQFAIAVGTSAIALFGSLLIYNAYQYGNATRLTPITYTQIVFTFIIDFAFFHPHVDVYHLLGAAMIVGASFSLAFANCIVGPEGNHQLNNNLQ
eukprot:TRINITY_DN213_c0_g1_i2.p1 TRINITY_DN213_c0_g1~~TRINITY_DN213_c0_g1_i2.p1  ORF type:complete len:424 (+),score=17.74 TRINITY_DN213_c0_g1_i2:170-1273(+)